MASMIILAVLGELGFELHSNFPSLDLLTEADIQLPEDWSPYEKSMWLVRQTNKLTGKMEDEADSIVTVLTQQMPREELLAWFLPVGQKEKPAAAQVMRNRGIWWDNGHYAEKWPGEAHVLYAVYCLLQQK